MVTYELLQAYFMSQKTEVWGYRFGLGQKCLTPEHSFFNSSFISSLQKMSGPNLPCHPPNPTVVAKIWKDLPLWVSCVCVFWAVFNSWRTPYCSPSSSISLLQWTLWHDFLSPKTKANCFPPDIACIIYIFCPDSELDPSITQLCRLGLGMPGHISLGLPGTSKTSATETGVHDTSSILLLKSRQFDYEVDCICGGMARYK